MRVACALPHPDQDPKKLDAAPPDFWHALEYVIGNEASVIDIERGSFVDKYRQMAEEMEDEKMIWLEQLPV